MRRCVFYLLLFIQVYVYGSTVSHVRSSGNDPYRSNFVKDVNFKVNNNIKTGKSFEIDYGTEPEFSHDYISEFFKTSPQTDSLLKLADELFREIERHRRFIDKLTGNELVEFPVGIRKELTPNSRLTLGVLNARMYPEYAEVDIFAKLDLGELGTDLLFGASGIHLSHKGGLVGEIRLYLLQDVPLIQNGGQWLLTFLGGIRRNGLPDQQTYITLDCEGKIQEISLATDIRISRNIALPLNQKGELKFPGKTQPRSGESPLGNNAYVGLQSRIQASSFSDLILEVDLPHFELTALPGWGILVKEAVIDLSDKRNSENIRFPDLYRELNLLPENNELWRGFFVRKLQVMLPPEFKLKKTDQRVLIGAENLILDEFGVSGSFFAEQVISLQEGIASGWQFSVDRLSAQLAANRFLGASFAGRIILPVSAESQKENPGMNYEGIIGIDKNYSMRIAVNNDIDFDVFKARARLYPESYITLAVEDGNFVPEANLSGVMSLNTSIGNKINNEVAKDNDLPDEENLEISGIAFQELRIKTVPETVLSVGYLGFKDSVQTPQLYGFKAGIYDIDFSSAGDRISLGFNSYIMLDETGIKGDCRFEVLGKLREDEYVRWTYDQFKINQVLLDVTRNNFSFKGQLSFFESDPDYGKGIAGDLELYSESLGMRLQGRGLFGRMDDFNYWYVDAAGQPIENDNSNFTFNDFGGGVYHHMRKASYKPGTNAPSGILYEPDQRVSLGFKALAAFEVKQSAVFNGLLGIEMSFNNKEHGGGVSRVGFYGAAALMASETKTAFSVSPFGSPAELQQEILNKEEALSAFGQISIDRMGVKYFANNVFPDVLSGKEIFAAQVAFDLDFTNQIYWGMFDTFLNLGQIKGDGEKNRLGYLEFYSAPDDWYIHVGTPDRRFGVRDIPFGPLMARMNIYFMTGTILPSPSSPPAIVRETLDFGDRELLMNRGFSSDLAAGRGYAFGAEFGLGVGFDWGVMYASVQAGIGFDLMMRDFGDTSCRNYDQPLGMNGWYANGQLYAFLQGDFGARINVFGMNTDIPILTAGVALLARGELPNPWYVEGYAGINVRLLGTVKIKTRLKVVLGEPCEMIDRKGLEDLRVIADFNPGDNLKEVDVFTSVQVAFNFPVDKPIKVPKAEGSVIYKISLEEAELFHGKKKVRSELSWNEQKDLLTLSPEDLLPSESELLMKVKVSFQRYNSGEWEIVTREGVPITEEERISFSTGKAPQVIPFHNISEMYPVISQRYLLKDESDDGFIQLKKGQDYLFGGNYIDEVEIVDALTGERQISELRYDKTNNRIRFDLPDFNLSSEYFLLITTRITDSDKKSEPIESWEEVGNGLSISSQKIGSDLYTDNRLIRIEFPFRTSRYATFREKLKSIRVLQFYNFIDGASDVAALGIGISDGEPFDLHETEGTQFTGFKPLIFGEALGRDEYYESDIHPLIYEEYPLNGSITLKRDLTVFGNPPLKALEVSGSYRFYLKYAPDHIFLNQNFPFVWRLPRYFKQDFLDLQSQLAARIFSFNSIDQRLLNRYKYLINGVFPYIRQETYRVDFNYVLPGKSSGKRVRFNFENTF
ncbi:hypothetical protein [Robertkochia aurantiaca]|uniref:hypothetical protein n=1 Tax=Robertkochia aurantiaca TaxID=2873700 RepID=UPI001CCD6E7E|nr:hypothetical protein [Robertkochia sp. 3YJGBD-33]